MFEVTLAQGETATISLDPGKDSRGLPLLVAAPIWSCVPEGFLAVTPSADRRSCQVGYKLPGTGFVQVAEATDPRAAVSLRVSCTDTPFVSLAQLTVDE